jgi:hypothetical protein
MSKRKPLVQFNAAKEISPFPDLTPWHETAIYDEKGNCIIPSSLSWQCEISYGIDHGHSALRQVKKHIRNFSYSKGIIVDLYRQVKNQLKFSHELSHVILGQFGLTLDNNPFMFMPFYDGNMQAEAFVVVFDDFPKNIQNGLRDIDFIRSKLNEDKYVRGVQAELNVLFGRDNFAKSCRDYNESIWRRNHVGSTLSAFDATRLYHHLNSNSESNSSDVPELGAYIRKDAYEGNAPDQYMVDESVIRSFYAYASTVYESILMTVCKVEEDLNIHSGGLHEVTVDIMLRTLKVDELTDVGLSGVPRSLSHGRLSLFQSSEDYVRGRKPFKIMGAKPKI